MLKRLFIDLSGLPVKVKSVTRRGSLLGVTYVSRRCDSYVTISSSVDTSYEKQLEDLIRQISDAELI